MSWRHLALLVLLPAALGAQIRPPRPPTPVRRTPGDTSRDSTKKDTALVNWTKPDSIMQSLMNRPGYMVTRYEGQEVTFDAAQNAIDILALAAKQAVVQRGGQTVVADSGIYYSNKTSRVDVTSKPGGRIVISDPASGQANIVSRGSATYNLAEHSARISHAVFPVNSGQQWYITANDTKVISDTSSAKASSFYGRGGTLTSCDDSIPDYHFAYSEVKRSSTNTLVARPAVLYIKDIPVMWLPFIFQDQRNGRHSGIITPQFGISDIIRNSPSYRRMIQDFGYYFALNDYMDARIALDWRSSANATAQDPGWLRYKGEWDYRWLDRFLSGRLGADYTTQSNGQTNLQLAWAHQQDFSRDAKLTTNMNYVTSTQLQRQNTFNPYAVLATISSQANFQDRVGPATLSLGGTRKQYPGRSQVDQTIPTLSISTTPINAGSWLTWTPNLSYTETASLHIDQPGPFQFRYFNDSLGRLDSATTNRSQYVSATTFDTPLRIFGYDLHNSFRINDTRNDFPDQYTIYDVISGLPVGTRVFSSTYRTDIDWTPDFQLPPFARNFFNVTPSVSLANVDPGPFWVRTERSNGDFVHQSKRLTFGLSAAPSIYGFIPGFGPFSLIRHSLQPSISWTYAPSASVDTSYLKALGRSEAGYLGALSQNAVSFGLTQNFEAKVKTPNDTGSAQVQKLKLLSINFSSLGYDFERAHYAGRAAAGFYIPTNENFNSSFRSDLLPGMDFNVNYSLFQGSTLSDTAKFKPYLDRISANFSIGRDNNPFTVLSRLFGGATPPENPPAQTTTQPQPSSAAAAQYAALPVAGATTMGGPQFNVPPVQGWQTSLNFSLSRPRPPVGGNVVNFDPTARCAPYASLPNPLIYQQCLTAQQTTPTTELPVQSTIVGGPAYLIPPTISMQANTSFSLTEKWSGSWNTTYDFVRHQFASHVVTLQRDLHDWRAVFSFTQSPNGNFAFSFFIALKAEQDLKFNYNRATYRNSTVFP